MNALRLKLSLAEMIPGCENEAIDPWFCLKVLRILDPFLGFLACSLGPFGDGSKPNGYRPWEDEATF